MTSQPPFSIFKAMVAFSSFTLRLIGALGLPAANGLWRGRGRFRGNQSHFRLELFDQFGGAQFLRLLLDLQPLLIDIAQGHIHAGFVDRGLLFDFAHHLIVRLADSSDFELLHGVGQTHDEMVRKIEEETAVNEARMDMALGNVDQQGLKIEEEAEKLRSAELVKQFKAEMGLISPEPSAPAAKTIGGRETERTN